MGLSLAGCPAGDDTSETLGGSESSTQGSTGMPGSTTDDGTTSFDVSSGPVGEAYGAPDTETFGTSDPTDSTSTGGDTDTGSSSGGDTDTEGTTGSGSSSSTSG